MSRRDIAISVKGLGKKYSLGGPREKYRTFRDAIVESIKKPIRRISQPIPTTEFWALKDVSFDVDQGEVIGIIGRNGAGKSTLLKILSRITTPTEGSVDLYGRVGSLLEIGTGFHPELTGRENIYLSGSILGMKKREIDSKIDEIVKFSEIEQFLDTPAKRYSSGMYVRLAFAVAAYMDTEILLVDEVLAVGDAAFQKKCLGKMGDISSNDGRTVLFVSHQMNTIRKLCPSSIWIENGKIKQHTETVSVLNQYEAEILNFNNATQRSVCDENKPVRFLSWEIINSGSEQKNWFDGYGEIEFIISVIINKKILNGHHGIDLKDTEGRLIWAWAISKLELDIGNHIFKYQLPTLPLKPGMYSFHVSLYDDNILLDEWHVLPNLFIVTKPISHPRDEWSGILNIPCDFHIERRSVSTYPT